MSQEPPASRNPTDPGAQLQKLLPEAESEAVFRSAIVPALLAHADRQAAPTVVVLSAQPGAGKTAVARLLRSEFGAADAVAVDVDGLKPFHPEIDTLRRDLGEVAADELVHADARRWLDKSLDYLATERQVNVVVEHGLRNPQVTDDLLGRFSTAGYRIEATLLTTPAAVSMQGVLLRYQAGHERGGGRDIDPQLHEQRYQGLLAIADALATDPRVDVIRLYRRDGTLVHRSERDATGRWDQPTPVREALEVERRRPWTIEESQAFLGAHNDLLRRMSPEWRPRIEACLVAAKPLLHPDVAPHEPQPAPGPQLSFAKNPSRTQPQPKQPPRTGPSAPDRGRG